MSKRKAPGNNPNNDLCDFLIDIANHEKHVTLNFYKASAYRRAAASLSKLSERVKSGNEAKKLPHIGEKIAKKIDEFLETGKLRKLENIHEDESNVNINLLTRVSGIDPSKAKELVDAGVKTLEDLKKNKNKLNDHQKLGLKYFDDFEKKIPRDEIVCIEKFIQKTLRELDKGYIMTICGSYRREEPESEDIHVLITHSDYNFADMKSKKKVALVKTVVKCLEKQKLITDTITLGKKDFMGVCRLPGDKSKPFRRLDIKLLPHDRYYCGVLYFTGNDLFYQDMEARALDKKYNLNRYSLRRIISKGSHGEAEKITCENDIFKILGMAYKEPKDRNM